jgi:hypothetical protein
MKSPKDADKKLRTPNIEENSVKIRDFSSE